MGKRKAKHVILGANAASAQGKGVGFNEEYSNEPFLCCIFSDRIAQFNGTIDKGGKRDAVP